MTFPLILTLYIGIGLKSLTNLLSYINYGVIALIPTQSNNIALMERVLLWSGTNSFDVINFGIY